MQHENNRNSLPPSPPIAQMWALEQLASAFASNQRPRRKKTEVAKRQSTRILAVLSRIP